jgi:hypothetical protein
MNTKGSKCTVSKAEMCYNVKGEKVSNVGINM